MGKDLHSWITVTAHSSSNKLLACNLHFVICEFDGYFALDAPFGTFICDMDRTFHKVKENK